MSDIDLAKVEDVEETPTSVSKKLSDEEIAANCETFRTKIKADKLFVENYRVDDEFLTRFLYCAKQDMTKAHARYFNYYKCITTIPDIDRVLNGDAKWLLEAMSAMKDNIPLKFYGFDKHGRGVVTFTMGAIDLNQPNALYAACVMSIIYLDYIQQSVPQIQTHGIAYVEDHGSMTRKHYMSMMTDMKLNKVLSDLFQGGMPLLMKSVTICNEPTVFSILWKMVKFFLSKKMLARIHIVGNQYYKVTEQLGGEEFVPNILPNGKAEPCAQYALTDEILKKHLLAAFPFHSEPDL